jgi:hypothetical protein
MIKHACALTLLSFAVGAQAQAVLGQNLIVNGDAEAGITGWTIFDGYSPIQSVAYGNNWVKPTEPGPVNRGQGMFTGTGARAAAYQWLDLGTLADQPLSYELSGWLGGWLAQEDNALLYVSFLDASSNEIGHADIGPVSPADRGSKTGLILRQASGLLPTGTTSLMFSLSMERLGGGDNDGYADNLSFTLTSAVPEASSVASLFAGLAALGLIGAMRKPRREG